MRLEVHRKKARYARFQISIKKVKSEQVEIQTVQYRKSLTMILEWLFILYSVLLVKAGVHLNLIEILGSLKRD